MKQHPYAKGMGKTRYLVSGSRIDVCYVINFLSCFMHNPGIKHWKSFKRVLRYLNHTKNYGICYSRSQSGSPLMPLLLGWSDSNWGGNLDSRRSTSGFLFMLAGGAISWSSKRQMAVILSSAEAEFVAVAQATKEGMWIQMLLTELNMIPQPSLITFQVSCIYLARNPKHSEKTKHMDLKYHFIREMVEEKKLFLEHTSTEDMWTDFLTKPLSVLRDAARKLVWSQYRPDVLLYHLRRPVSMEGAIAHLDDPPNVSLYHLDRTYRPSL
ncbi:hypothetical protein L7F22_047136 [Adiantum nelumboides]|nr:hypothetical protein [Adiantum nelumboides]